MPLPVMCQSSVDSVPPGCLSYPRCAVSQLESENVSSVATIHGNAWWLASNPNTHHMSTPSAYSWFHTMGETGARLCL